MEIKSEPTDLQIVTSLINQQAAEAMKQIATLQNIAEELASAKILSNYSNMNSTYTAKVPNMVTPQISIPNAYSRSLTVGYPLNNNYTSTTVNPSIVNHVLSQAVMRNYFKPDLQNFDTILKKQKIIQVQQNGVLPGLQNSFLKQDITPLMSTHLGKTFLSNQITGPNFGLSQDSQAIQGLYATHKNNSYEEKKMSKVNEVKVKEETDVSNICKSHEFQENSFAEILKIQSDSLTVQDDEYIKRARLYGKIAYGDKIKSILSMKFDDHTKDILYLVKWKRRKTGKRPLPSYVKKEELIRLAPKVYKNYCGKLPLNINQ